MTGPGNLRALYAQVDHYDRSSGALAYLNYHEMMRRLARHHGTRLDLACAVFAATSPNNDYYGNLRSAASILDAHRRGLSRSGTVVSCYRHCAERAFDYLDGTSVFERDVKGPKILAFYDNLLRPATSMKVTVDGHMVGAYRGVRGTMKTLIPRRGEYEEVASAIRDLASSTTLLPHQVQAMLWFARRRTLGIRYVPQMLLFAEEGDRWDVLHDARDVLPYPRRDGQLGLPGPPQPGLLGALREVAGAEADLLL